MNLETLVLPLKADSSAFNGAIKAATAGVVAATAAMAIAVKATFDWANELDGIGDSMDTTTQKAAAYNFVLRKSGTATDVFTKAQVILGKGLVDAGGKLDSTGKALKEWGINVLDSNKVLKDQDTLIQEVADKYATLGTQQERINFLTEVYGKSGAGLVDFFDTLASEGGIDAVTKKVEALGLAIDPGRYEQFNRNLEELKLIGLGLAVGFTEKVMPAVEKFTGFLTEFAADPDLGKLADNLDTFVAKVIKGMGDSINDWVSGGGPEELSDNIISWIDNIGTGENVKPKFLIAAEHLFSALGDAITEIDWMGIGMAIDEKVLESIEAHDWTATGDLIGDKIAALFTQMDESEVDSEWLVRVLLPGFYSAANFLQSEGAQAIGQAIKDLWEGAAGPDNIAAFGRMGDHIRAKLAEMGANITAWSAETWATIKTWGANLLADATTAINDLDSRLDTKLREIGKTFFNRATAWTQQAVRGFQGGIGELLAAIRDIVQSINAELKKIITSFSLSFLGIGGGGSSPGSMGGFGTGSTAPRPGGGGGSGGASATPRASGGPVIAGQEYSVAEFFRPEKFTPAVNGRIDSIGAPQLQMVTITNWDDLDYARLAAEIVKAEVNK